MFCKNLAITSSKSNDPKNVPHQIELGSDDGGGGVGNVAVSRGW